MTGQHAKIPLLIFAKAPIPGKVKTRLQPQISMSQSAELAQLLLQITVQQAVCHWPGEVILSAGLDVKHEYLVGIAKQYKLRIEPQAEGDLGQRMDRAMDQFGYPAAIIGSDIPQINQLVLQSAYTHLSNGKNVLGPCDDGGYYLVGLASNASELFEEISWGTENVLHQTLQKARLMELPLEQLTPLNDVDTWTDLNNAARSVPQLMYFIENI